jgi:hypothetical protein
MILLASLQQSRVIALLNVQPARTQDVIFPKDGRMRQNISSEFRGRGCGFRILIFILFRWLYCMIITIDACFRLKLKEKGITGDPALGDGWAHWVSSKPYLEYVKKYGYQVEVTWSADCYYLCIIV